MLPEVVMRTLIILACTTAVILLLAAEAFACEPVQNYDWAVPPESDCVTFVGPPQLPGSPELEITNGCNSTITVTPVDCLECDVELVLRPAETGNFTVHAAVGENETAEFGLRWEDEGGRSGTIHGNVSRQEGADDGCGNDGVVCAMVDGDRRTDAILLLLMGAFVLVRRTR
jgi:hypothetical protein